MESAKQEAKAALETMECIWKSLLRPNILNSVVSDKFGKRIICLKEIVLFKKTSIN